MDRATRTDLSAARTAALDLHKVLLETVRQEYERTHGRVENPAELLRLVAQDPAFAWLRPLSQWIVAWGECEANPEASPSDVAALRGEIARLLEAPHFRPQYLDCLQREPDAVLAHARLKRHLA